MQSKTIYYVNLWAASLMALATSASAQGISLDDGLWSGGLQKKGTGRTETLQVQVKKFGNLSKVVVNLTAWDKKWGTCTYLASGERVFSLVSSESNITENCAENTSLDVVSNSPAIAEVRIAGFAESIMLYSAYPNPASFPKPTEPQHAVDILKIRPNMPEDEALKIAADLGFVQAYENNENKELIHLGRGEKFKAYPDSREEFPDLLELHILETPRGRMVASVHRAEVFPKKDHSADTYIAAFSDKYGEEPSSGWKYKYDGKREYGFNPCGEVPIMLDTRVFGRTPTGGATLTLNQIDASCAYQVDYTISSLGDVITGYSIISISPFVYYEAIYPKWAEAQADELRSAAQLRSSTDAPEL